jgi:hypothetical protein
MHCRHHSVTVLVAIVVGVIASAYAQAASRVGGATNVVRDVSGSVTGQSWGKKAQGDDVYENEFIRTQAESSARISFIDETDIRIGPAATIKIDRVVFKSNRSVSELIVTADAGPMRWNSGISLSSAYQVKTPTAIIKVHGTAFDLFAEPQQTTVILRRGTIEVCLIDSPQRCQTLSQSGDTIVATSNDLERPQRAGLGPSEFVERCLSANMIAPCVIMAGVQPTRSGSVTSPPPGRGTMTPPPTGPIYGRPGGSGDGVSQPPPTGPIYGKPSGTSDGPPATGPVYGKPSGTSDRPPTTGPVYGKPSGTSDGPSTTGPIHAKSSGSSDGVSQKPPTTGPIHAKPSGSSDGVSQKPPTSMPSSPRRMGNSPRRAIDSNLAYVKPSSPKQTYVKPIVRPTYVRPIVRQTYVRPAPQRPTPIR